jgi:hypothetical protein
MRSPKRKVSIISEIQKKAIQSHYTMHEARRVQELSTESTETRPPTKKTRDVYRRLRVALQKVGISNSQGMQG